MSLVKRSPRCSYCYNQGHNRNNCPTAKQAAANGDTYAQRVVERAAVKKCSYCNGTDHTKTTCEKLYRDEHDRAQKEWTGMVGVAEVIKNLKLATGAFVYGPMMFYSNSMPDSDHSYELVNYTVNDLVKIRPSYFTNEASSLIRCATLAEPTEARNEFRTTIPVPGLYEAVATMQAEFPEGQKMWLRDNDANGYTRVMSGRQNMKDLTQVILPATDEEVNKAVNVILGSKPEILKHPDRKSYQRAIRAAKKAEKGE